MWWSSEIFVTRFVPAGDRTVASESARLIAPLQVAPSRAPAVASGDVGVGVAPAAVHEVEPKKCYGCSQDVRPCHSYDLSGAVRRNWPPISWLVISLPSPTRA